MRILILNWRDIKNPASGGAEILTHEVAKRLLLWGNDVVQFSSLYPGSLQEEVVDGIRIIRKGNPDTRALFFSVHFQAFLFYKRTKEKFDVVIDEVHGIPFFTPLYVEEKKVVLICEVARDLWIKHFSFFFGIVGLLTEKLYLSKIYQNISFVTISPSTKKDLIANGVREDNITVLPMGISTPKGVQNIKKEKQNTLIFVGRLTPAKGIEEALQTLKEVLKQDTSVRLWIVGRGGEEYTKYLMDMCRKLQIENNVTFFGFVSEQRKFELLARAHILLHQSGREGFGLTIPEAGFVGTPVISYNAPGLRDVVKHGMNGILLIDNSVQSTAKEVISLLNNSRLYQKLCKGAKQEARYYNWDNTARSMLTCLRSSRA